MIRRSQNVLVLLGLMVLCSYCTGQNCNIKSCDDSLKILDQWSNGFRAELRIPAAREIHPFRFAFLRFKFSSSLQHFRSWSKSGGSVKIKPSRNSDEYRLMYRPGRHVPKGALLRFGFVAKFPRNQVKAKLVEVGFGRDTVCSENCSSVTTETPTTTRPGPTPSEPSCKKVFKIMNIWPNGYLAKLTLPVTRKLRGWKLILQFDKPLNVLDIWSARILSHRAGNYFELGNFHWNSRKEKGSKLHLLFNTWFGGNGRTVPKIELVVFDSFTCRNSNLVTTPPPDTTALLTTTPQIVPTTKPIVTTEPGSGSGSGA